MERDERHAQGVKQTLETMIGTDLSLKRKKKSENDLNRELFEKIILALEKVNVRTAIIGAEFDLDLTKYDEEFYTVIDNLISMHFGKEVAEVIFFYIYERLSPDGSVNELMDENNNIVPLNTPADLWELLKVNQNKLGRQRKK